MGVWVTGGGVATIAIIALYAASQARDDGFYLSMLVLAASALGFLFFLVKRVFDLDEDARRQP
jgi:hypothetical protein